MAVDGKCAPGARWGDKERADTLREDAMVLVGRIDRLPACWATWRPAVLVSLAAIFEVYDLYQTAYVSPGLIRSGIFSRTGAGFLGLSDQAMFGSVTFIGLFVGATCFTSFADRRGRRAVFLYALLAYSAATAFMAFQSTAPGIYGGRFLAGVGLGVELVTIDAYLVEVVPSHMRGRAFALNHTIQYLGVPAIALLAWLLVPGDPLGVAGWRWVVMAGAVGALLAWFLRRHLPESPRWLALQGRGVEAVAIVARVEAEVVLRTGRSLAPAQPSVVETPRRASLVEIFQTPHRQRTIMLGVFNFFQTIGFFGFSNWLPALLVAQGHDITKSLFYSFCIAWAYPLTPLLWGATVAERFERKWLIVAASLGVLVAGPLFAITSQPVLLVVLGIAITGFSTLLSLVSSDIGNPSRCDTENPATSATVVLRLMPVRVVALSFVRHTEPLSSGDLDPSAGLCCISRARSRGAVPCWQVHRGPVRRWLPASRLWWCPVGCPAAPRAKPRIPPAM